MEQPDQIGNRRKPLQIIDNVATPKYLRIIPMRPTSHWPSEGFKKFFVNVRKLGQHCLDLLNNRRQWSLLTKCSNITTVGHREARPSCLVESRWCISTGGSTFPSAALIYVYNTIHCMELSILFDTKMDILQAQGFLSRGGVSGT
jgi:hypothetical protein